MIGSCREGLWAWCCVFFEKMDGRWMCWVVGYSTSFTARYVSGGLGPASSGGLWLGNGAWTHTPLNSDDVLDTAFLTLLISLRLVPPVVSWLSSSSSVRRLNLGAGRLRSRKQNTKQNVTPKQARFSSCQQLWAFLSFFLLRRLTRLQAA